MNKMSDDNGKPFIATLHNVILASDLCGKLFSIVELMNLVHTCLFYKGSCTLYIGSREKIQLHYHIVHKGNMHFWGN